jgi:CPA1 family monovalent cation:H+ antiporter
VLVTIGAVAVVAHEVAGIGWGPALVLGAILGPTDPVAATSVLRRLGAPDRISTILEGEALVNDGTGLTVYKLAVAAVVSDHFSPGLGVVKFIGVSAGVVAIGLVAGWLSVEVRKRIDEPQIEISISLLTAYLAYIPADRVGVSGVLAAVAAGLYTGSRTGLMLSPPPGFARSASGTRSPFCSNRCCSCSSACSFRTSRAVSPWRVRSPTGRRYWSP